MLVSPTSSAGRLRLDQRSQVNGHQGIMQGQHAQQGCQFGCNAWIAGLQRPAAEMANSVMAHEAIRVVRVPSP